MPRPKRRDRRAEAYAKRVTARQVRRTARRAQLRVGLKTIEVKQIVSPRGRISPAEAAAPGQPITPQTMLLLSTALRKFKYNIKSRTLRIWFVKGGIYDYFEVPQSVVFDLDRAPSKGNYFYYNIRTTFKYQKVS